MYTFWHTTKNTIFSGYAVCFALHSRFFHAHQKVYFLTQCSFSEYVLLLRLFIFYVIYYICNSIVSPLIPGVNMICFKKRYQPQIFDTNVTLAIFSKECPVCPNTRLHTKKPCAGNPSTGYISLYYSVVYGNKAITLARLIATVRAL